MSIRNGMYAVLTSKAKYIRDSIDMGSPRVFISIINDSKKIEANQETADLCS